MIDKKQELYEIIEVLIAYVRQDYKINIEKYVDEINALYTTGNEELRGSLRLLVKQWGTSNITIDEFVDKIISLLPTTEAIKMQSNKKQGRVCQKCGNEYIEGNERTCINCVVMQSVPEIKMPSNKNELQKQIASIKENVTKIREHITTSVGKTGDICKSHILEQTEHINIKLHNIAVNEVAEITKSQLELILANIGFKAAYDCSRRRQKYMGYDNELPDTIPIPKIPTPETPQSLIDKAMQILCGKCSPKNRNDCVKCNARKELSTILDKLQKAVK